MRYVFFSFAYDDVVNFKVNVVRKSWLINHRAETFVDGSIWETVRIKRRDEIRNLIDVGLKGTSVTVALIGSNTADRHWVNYELLKSFGRGNGILGIHINRIRGRTGRTRRGKNPLDRLGLHLSDDGKEIYFYELRQAQWTLFMDAPKVNNRLSNAVYFNHTRDFGRFFRLSDLFPTYCWDLDDGHGEFSDWVEDAATAAGR